MFYGFSEDTIQFFVDIKFQNNSTFFQANKARYEKVKLEFAQLISALQENMELIDSNIDFRPGKALARIRRDTRFSKDKTPYRDHLWFLMRRSGEDREGAPFFWFELGIHEATYGVGIWGEPKPFYDTLRQELRKNPKECGAILKSINQHGFQAYGERYKRIAIPSTLPEEVMDIYKAKSYYITKKIDPYATVFSKDLVNFLALEYQNLAKFYLYARKIVEKMRMENQ